jgi:hypothetical protein
MKILREDTRIFLHLRTKIPERASQPKWFRVDVLTIHCLAQEHLALHTRRLSLYTIDAFDFLGPFNEFV